MIYGNGSSRARMHGAVALGAMVAIAAACESPPRRDVGSSGGRINPYATTGADERSHAASMPALYEFGDRTGQNLARRINEIPEIRGADSRVVIELGDIENHTQTPRSDFEMIQRRLRGQLINSDIVTTNVRFVESVWAMEREKDRVATADPGGTDRYGARSTYVLRGSFYESARGRGDTRRYYFEFQLTNLQTRDIVFVDTFDLALQS